MRRIFCRRFVIVILIGLASLFSALSPACAQVQATPACDCPTPPPPPKPQCGVTWKFDPIPPPPAATVSLVNPLNPQSHEPINVVVLGDSVMWGNGLHPEEKFSWLFGQKLAEKTSRPVQIYAFAHSGARLYAIDDVTSAMHQAIGQGGNPQFQGDISSQRPTTVEQEQCAASMFPNAEVVLLDGCINDVGATNIAFPPAFSHLNDEATAKQALACGGEMWSLLHKTLSDFPNATISLINYYRIVSNRSEALPPAGPAQHIDDIVKLSEVQAKMKPGTLTGTLSEQKKQEFATHWGADSDAFLLTTQSCFLWAIQQAPRDSTHVGDPCKEWFPKSPNYLEDYPAEEIVKIPLATPVTPTNRIFLASWPDRGNQSFGAPATLIWYLTAFSHDAFFDPRQTLCKNVITYEHLSKLASAPLKLDCANSPTAHPNIKGAVAYSERLMIIFERAWVTPAH